MSSSMQTSIPDWGSLMRGAAYGKFGPRFPNGTYTEIDLDETDSETYSFTATWEPFTGGAFKRVEISIIVNPDPTEIYNWIVRERFQYKPWQSQAQNSETWMPWPESFLNKKLDGNLTSRGSTKDGLKVAWVQGRNVVVCLQSLAGHRVLKSYADQIYRMVDSALQ